MLQCNPHERQEIQQCLLPSADDLECTTNSFRLALLVDGLHLGHAFFPIVLFVFLVHGLFHILEALPDILHDFGADLDYDGPWNSPPRTFTPAETRAIADALARVSDDELRARYRPDEMMKAEIYPEIWDREPDGVEDPQGFVMSALADVRAALNVAVERGWGLIVAVD